MRQAGVALIVQDGLILAISRRNDKSLFGLPGGKFDKDAGDRDTKDTAIRETYEETSVIVKDCRQIFQANDHEFVARCYYVLDWEGEPTTSEEGEVGWLTADELLTTKAAFPEYNKHALQAFRLLYPDIKIQK